MSTTTHHALAGNRDRILDAAETLFAAEGITPVTLQNIADHADLDATSLTAEFSTKNEIVETVLDQRHAAWMTKLQTTLNEYGTPEDKLLGIFTFLEHWFAEETFHRCAFVTSYGELGPSAGWVDIMVRRHKQAFDTLVGDLAADAALPHTIASSLALLADGAQVTAAATGRIAAARDARSSAAVLIAMYRTEPHDILFG